MARRDGPSPEVRQDLISAAYRTQRNMLKILQPLIQVENPTPAQVENCYQLLTKIGDLDQFVDDMLFRAKLDPN